MPIGDRQMSVRIPLLEVKRTSRLAGVMSAFDPKRTSPIYEAEWRWRAPERYSRLIALLTNGAKRRTWPPFPVCRRCTKIPMLRKGELPCRASSATRSPLLPQSHYVAASAISSAQAQAKFKNTTGPTKGTNVAPWTTTHASNRSNEANPHH